MPGQSAEKENFSQTKVNTAGKPEGDAVRNLRVRLPLWQACFEQHWISAPIRTSTAVALVTALRRRLPALSAHAQIPSNKRLRGVRGAQARRRIRREQ